MSTLELDRYCVYYDDRGAGPPVVLVHGGAATHRYWDGVLRELPDKYRTVAPDLFGCGSTSSWTGATILGHDQEALLIRSVIDAVGHPVHLVGHSYGAAACLRAAISSPENIQSMTLIEPPIYRLLKQAQEVELYEEISTFRSQFTDLAAGGHDSAAMELLVDRFNGAGTWKGMSQRAHSSLLSVVDALVIGFTANAENPTSLRECNNMTISTLLPWGQQSGAPERAMVEILSQSLPHNHSVSIAGAMHQSPLTHPKAVADLIAEHTSES